VAGRGVAWPGTRTLDYVAQITWPKQVSVKANSAAPSNYPSLAMRLEVVPARLGMETQRQWANKAIRRSTPALLGLFSIITLRARVMIGGV
jgi:hypothetical protein